MSRRGLILFLFCLANCAISFNFAALAAAVPALSLGLHQSENVVSQISAYYMIPYGLGALLYAPLARKISFKVILSSSMLIYGILNFLCVVYPSIGFILAARILMGIAAACVIPLCLISIGSVFEKKIRGRMVGLFFSTSFIASVAGITVSGFCDWQWLFIVPGILGIVAAICVLSGPGDMIHSEDLPPVDYLRVLRQVNVRNILLFIFVISFLYHGIHKWLAVYLHRQYDLGQPVISAFFILIALAGVFGQNIGGHITDKHGRFIACYWGVIILAVTMMLLLGHHPLTVVCIVLTMFSIGWAIGHNGVSTVLTDFPEENRSEIAGLNSAIRFFSGGLGFFVGGPFVEQNIALTFFGFGVVMFLTSFFVKRIIPQTSC